MEFTILVKDYRIIQDAKLTLHPGITLISAHNRSGKSTLLKALKTLVDGTYGSDTLPRHGTDGYTIAVKMDDEKLILRRRGTQTFLKYNDEAEVSKLGRGSLSELEPRFKFRRVDYQDSKFYPNFSFQNSVPLFDDISVFDLFSSMFAPVAKVNDRLDLLKKDLTKQNELVKTKQAQLEFAKSQQAASEQELEAFNTKNPDLERNYELSCQAVELNNKIQAQKQLVDMYLSGHNVDQAQKQYQDYVDASKLFNTLSFVQAVESKLSTVETLKNKLKHLQVLPDVDFNLLHKGATLSNYDDRLDKIKINLDEIPDLVLLKRQEELKALQAQLLSVNLSLEEVTKNYDAAVKEAKLQGCPYQRIGTCPFKE